MAERLLQGSPDHEAQLQRLGLAGADVRESVGAGNIARKIPAVGHCAMGAPGYFAWNGVLTRLSQLLRERGWKRRDPSSLPALLNESTKVVLTVSSGDRLTGYVGPRIRPSTKNPKGELTRELQRRNGDSAAEGLFEAQRKTVDLFLKDTEDFEFWVLLVHFDSKEKEIRYEVSRPLGSDARGYTNSWLPRIILPPYKLSDDDFDDRATNSTFGKPINVPVEEI